ncbi:MULTISPECIES: hypothetical protein [unclassified Nocardioides]|uniref:hypothetical protein n=1 Tax=unclassified Nocardioides TaxID=2615069 RepID=UPI000A42A7B8|nr:MULTISPECIES: hypothetical protein [unclassified Nocardioides]
MASLPRPLSRVAVGLFAALVLTSCGSESGPDDTSGADPSDTASVEASDVPSESAPTETESSPPPSSSSASSAPSTTTEAPVTSPVDDLFLTADEMPGLNDITVWTDAGTKPEGSDPFGDCAKFSLVDSGADEAWIRTFKADGNQRAAQLIATFADDKSAWRVEQVLRGWHRDCAAQLNADVEQVNPLQAAQVSAGKSFTYLLQFGQKDAQDHHFNGVAVNRVGSRLSIVLIDNQGQDYNYEPGQEPAQQAARAVAEKLG